MGRRFTIPLGLGAGAALLATAISLAGGTDRADEPRSALRDPPPPALHVRAPRPLGDQADVSMWTTVLRPVTARTSPAPGARQVAALGRTTPEGTANVLLVLGRTRSEGRAWVRVSVPALPNGTTGWLPRSTLGAYHVVRTRLRVDRRKLRVTLFRGKRAVLRAPIGVGRPRWSTPAGRFYIRNRLERYDSPFYGPVAFGTSARSAVLTDWPAGGFIGIHGTNRPDLIPGRVSHGCIRMRNRDILRLARLMPVGTPVVIS